jgi:hypothetical protein
MHVILVIQSIQVSVPHILVIMVNGQLNHNVYRMLVIIAVHLHRSFSILTFCTGSTVGCSYSKLINYTQTATGIQTVGQNSLLQVAGQSDLLMNGSYIVFSCATGYVNTGGSLNVTCNSNGSWSNFPNCVLNSATQCSIDPSSSAFTIANGYMVTGSVTSATTGNYILLIIL